MALLTGFGLCSCTEANEYVDTPTDNPSWSSASHPESLASTKYVRATGIKVSAFGQEVQGFVESLDFVSADSVSVKMSQGVTEGTWTDESNTEKVPLYAYTYNTLDGKIEISKSVKDDKGKVSKTVIFIGSAVSGEKELITIVHHGDTPAQTYLVKQ
jgi:hypothetical protein